MFNDVIKKTLVFKDGTRAEVKEEIPLYYVCENAKFRKNNPFISEVITERLEMNPPEISEEELEQYEEELEEKKNKKISSRKPKRKED